MTKRNQRKYIVESKNVPSSELKKMSDNNRKKLMKTVLTSQEVVEARRGRPTRDRYQSRTDQKKGRKIVTAYERDLPDQLYFNPMIYKHFVVFNFISH